MNRIYQGRVSKVEVYDSSTKKGDWKPITKWEDALWEHHQLFQDAVNYYLIALASLADPAFSTTRLVKDLRTRMSTAWADFPRITGSPTRNLRQSVSDWLHLPEDASLEDAFKAVLEGNAVQPAILTKCLENLLEGLLGGSGDGKIQTAGRGEAPKFVSANSTASFRYEHARKDLARLKLILKVHGLIEGDLNECGVLDLATTSKRRKPTSGGLAKTKLLQHLAILERENVIPASVCAQAASELKPMKDEEFAVIPAYEAGGESREKSIGIPLLLIGKQLGFPDWCRAALRRVLIAPSNWQDALAACVAAESSAASQPDPLEESRGARGFVFKAFTALPAWAPKSPGEPVWIQFDIAAFKEALKALNQFSQKTQDRTKEEDDLRGQLALMLGSSVKGWKPLKNEANESEPIPEPLDPRLFQLVRELELELTGELADSVLGREIVFKFGTANYIYREGQWQISTASLRGYEAIEEEWKGLYERLGEALEPNQLEEIVKKHQRDERNKFSIGSVPLFLKLCEKKFWPLWQARRAGADELAGTKTFLESVSLFHRKVREYERSLVPINLTPAEPRHSRRLYMFSDVTNGTAKVTFGKAGPSYTVECAIALRDGGGLLRQERVRLFYSARRLLRDELQGGCESRWLQPMTKALGLELGTCLEGTTFDSAVCLMPDFGGDGLRFLLNFPVTLDPSGIHSALGKATRWKRQFNGTRESKFHLHWPGTITGKQQAGHWWQNPDITRNGFTCFSVDLGLRTAGAWALLRVSCSDPKTAPEATRRPVREVGSDGERTWFAEVVSTGVLRLPGEDQRVIGMVGGFQLERSGKAGRNAQWSEWLQGRELATALLAQSPDPWLGGTPTDKSFPEQNDALIALANRRLTRLNTFHRWSCFDPDRPEVAHRRESLVQHLLEELDHWQDPGISAWKLFLDRAEFAAFRRSAGEAFEKLRDDLAAHLTILANRVVPLRDRSWVWRLFQAPTEDGVYGELTDAGAPIASGDVWVRGQRGLSMRRIEQLENLRRLFLRFNRSFDRKPGQPAKFGRAGLGRSPGEPCRALLQKIERIKDQRVNQTAHLILAEALGVRLRNHETPSVEREVKDIHGEYEKIPGRQPVDFIVIENLDRYLTSQGRAPSENSRLMKWSHRAIRDKLKMLSEEPFGIPVVETASAYSSRFSAVTGEAGARCEERTGLDPSLKAWLQGRAEGPAKPGQPEPEVYAALLAQFDELEKLNHRLRTSRIGGKTRPSLYTLFLPKQGGPLFMPLQKDPTSTSGKLPTQADINAAINIGLRALAAPNKLSLLHKIRTERDGPRIKPLTRNCREKSAFDPEAVVILSGSASKQSAKSRNPNFFVDPAGVAYCDSGVLNAGALSVPVASGIGLWGAVNQGFPRQLLAINARRLARWRERKPEEDNVPM